MGHCASTVTVERPVQTSAPRIALLGPPNVGKSSLFTALTGIHRHVGNWPGKTVTLREGRTRFPQGEYLVVDLPGTYGLGGHSEEEREALRFLLEVRPDVVVVVANAAAPEYGLYLLAEVLPLGLPTVLALNMADVAARQGVHIDLEALRRQLGVPVVLVSAARGQGLETLLEAVTYALFRPRPTRAAPEIPRSWHETVARWEALLARCSGLPFPASWAALKLLEGHPLVEALVRERCPEVAAELQKQRAGNGHREAFLDLASARYAWVQAALQAGFRFPDSPTEALTDRLDRILAHPYLGLPLLLIVLAGVYWLTFRLALPLSDWLQTALLGGLARALTPMLRPAPVWFQDLVLQGVLSGVGLVLSFFPILAVFFTALAVLEDAGYMARVAYIMHRTMARIGLSGRVFLPLFLGFGCNVPAVLGARIADSRKARLMTVLLAPFMPCTARMAVVTFLAPAFFGPQAPVVVWALVALNLLALLPVGLLLNRWLPQEEAAAAFIMEMPPYRWPQPRVVALFVWENLREFVAKAGTVILLVAVGVWALAYFPGGDVYDSYLARLGPWLAPLGRWLGWSDWRLPVALLTSFLAKENTIATLGVLYGLEPGSTLAQNVAEVLAPAARLSFLVVQMLFVPCAATVSAIRQEVGLRWAVFSVLLMLAVSLLAGALTFYGVQAVVGG